MSAMPMSKELRDLFQKPDAQQQMLDMLSQYRGSGATTSPVIDAVLAGEYDDEIERLSQLPPEESARLLGEGSSSQGSVAENMQGGGAASQGFFVPSVTRTTTGMDPITQQVLFGLGGQGGFIPGAMRAAERTYFDEAGRPIVIPGAVAGFTPDQLAAFQLTREQLGVQQPYLRASEQALFGGIGGLREAQRLQEQQQLGALRETQLGAAEEAQLRAQGLEELFGGIGEARRGLAGATGEFGQRLGGIESLARGAAEQFGGRLGESEELLRQTTGAFDPSMTQQFYDPYEQGVVQQTISDIMEQGQKADVAARAGDIARGGESAFGSRARLGAGERQEALGRGLAEAISGIRSAGFQRAQEAARGEFGRQQDARRAAALGLAGSAGQRLGAQQQLAGTLGQTAGQRFGAQRGLAESALNLGQTGQQALFQAGQYGLGTAGQVAGARGQLAGMYGQQGMGTLGAQQALGQQLAGLGQQAQQAVGADVAALGGIGALQQQQNQQILEMQRQAALQAQQAPLQQYQSLMPFINMIPRGTTNIATQMTPMPSALQAGLATGLGTLGALGSFYGGIGGQQQSNPYAII